jgi:hypothetical protein
VPRPAGDARKLKAIDVIDVLSDLFILQGIPTYIRSDNGPEFVAKAVQEWLAREAAWMARWRPLSFFFRGRRGAGDRREHHELSALTDEEYSAADEQPAGTRLHDLCERGMEFTLVGGVHHIIDWDLGPN